MTTIETQDDASDISHDDGYIFLRGNFAPVADEVTVTELEVEGAIPTSLTGRYLRTGPNPVVPPDPDNYHWFGGDGMVHGVELSGGSANWYRNRWVRSPEVVAALGEADIVHDEGGWYPGSGNTNVVHHAGSIWAITEGSLPYELSPELESLRTSNFGGPLPGGWNAHPKFDPVTNELHVISYGFLPPYALYHVISTDGRVVRTEAIDTQASVMIHDMGFTESRIVVFDLPVLFQLEAAMAGVGLPFQWDPTYNARVGVLARDGAGADTQWIEVEPCYVYHPLNAFDDGDRVVMDVVVHPRAFDDEARRDPSQGVPVLERWVIDTAAGTTNRTVISDHGQEFPRADERLAGRRHRYGYALGNTSLASIGGIEPEAHTYVLKHDVVAGTTTRHDLGKGRVGSEFVFVPDRADAGEDEGWLLGYVYDCARGASDLVILDAHDFGADPVARVKLPVRVPQGFHGNWIPDRALG